MKNSSSVAIVGGGQLGRMLIQECIDLGIDAHVLDPDKNAPCAHIATTFTCGSLTDEKTLYNFGKKHDIITIEIENVNVKALYRLEKEGKKVYPQPHIIEMVQNKGLQKTFLHQHGFPTAPYTLVADWKEIPALVQDFPVVQKVRKGGYDGRGVHILRKKKDLDALLQGPSILETCIPFEREISVMVARSAKGEIKSFPVVDMEFNSKANLVEFLFAPSQLSKSIQKKATRLAEDIIRKLKMVGILAVEMFVTKDGQIFVNEMAPRPHNSGHHTIEANITSQYGQHLRAILGFPLGDTTAIHAAVMVNLLGEPKHDGPAYYRNLDQVLAMPGNYVHIYGKKNTRGFRKMGHVTIVAKTLKAAIAQAKIVQKKLKVVSR